MISEVSQASDEGRSDPERLVVVVSDDPHVREELEHGFPSGVVVRMAIDAREAWGLMDHATPSVVVVDLQTGSAGGFALSKDMHDVLRLARVPILMLLDRRQDEWLAKQAEATAVRLKPIEVTRLVGDVMSMMTVEGSPLPATS